MWNKNWRSHGYVRLDSLKFGSSVDEIAVVKDKLNLWMNDG